MFESGLIRSMGAGPDLVMIHGWGAHSDVWGEFAAGLSSRFRLHQVDLPGHGRLRHMEHGFDVDTLLEEILERCPAAHWLGWSLGGVLAMMAALKSPARLGRLVLLSSSACFRRAGHWPQGMPGPDFDAFRAGVEQDVQATLKRFIALQVHGARDAARTRQVLDNCVDSAPPAKPALLAGLDTLATSDLSAQVSRIVNRAMLISGRQDKVVSDAATAHTAALMPGSVHHSIPDAGHAPFVSHSEELSALVRNFLLAEPAP